MKKLVAILILLGVGGGLAWYFIRQKNLLLNYDKQLIGIKIANFSLQSATIDFIIRFTNKSAIEATISKLYAELYLSNVYIGYLTNTTPALIPGNGQADILIEITFSPQVVLKDVITLIASGMSLNNLPFRLIGYGTISSGIIGVSVPFDMSGTVGEYL